MRRLLNLLQRALAQCAIYYLEIQLHDQTNALQHVTSLTTYRDIFRARAVTQRELLKARQHYIDLLPPGQRRTWRTA